MAVFCVYGLPEFFTQAPHKIFCILIKNDTGRSEDYTSGCAVEQFCPKFIFKGMDLPGNCGLSDIQGFSSPCKIEMLSY